MAVSVDVEALIAAAGPRAGAAGREYVARGSVSGLTSVDGGVRACVAEIQGGRTHVFVSVVSRALVVDCDRDSEAGGQPCEHAVAAVLAARDAGISWTSMAVPCGAEPAVAEDRLVTAAATSLTRAELVRLIVTQAAEDRLFEARVLHRAGRLGPADEAELARLRELVRHAGRIPDSGEHWELHELLDAGRELLTELEIVAVRPASAEFVGVVEDAIGVWDKLAGYLLDAWDADDAEPGTVGDALAALHLRLCEELRPGPVELGQRLAALVGSTDLDSCLDAPDSYVDLLGAEGLTAYDAALHR
ncbi:hypothetical protein [Frankia sp. AgKG'84/4]|uniref:hypothetical protein n=1 Tax=Frankia sp. AgKG'84/4 TaxID=573490 RepID=UPI00200C490A|nr:hypothetical protein [Frankia sp. AgKG'84/4]MCL9794575.1 hypothetical protein [Frankia sp. AgKG'84/4]